MNQICPICQSSATHFLQDKRRTYLKCPNCQLIFVPKENHVSVEIEKKRYDKHINTKKNKGYIAQFKNLIEQISMDHPKGAKGLDFGSGPSPVLAKLLTDKGFNMSIYDLFYTDTPEIFKDQYDFISATEVIEHLANPVTEMKRLWDCIKPGGKLYILTQRYPVKKEFLQWYYKNDPTHISYFQKETFKELAAILSAELEMKDKTLVILTK